jgi:hypothetical protein
MRAIVLAALLTGAAALAGCKSPTPDPETAFDAFKAVCIDTKARPADVAAAVKALGGVEQPKPESTTPPPYPMDGRFWNLKLKSGRQLWVASMVSKPTAYPAETDESCTITTHGKDPQSAAAARAWAGDRAEEGFMFRGDPGGEHMALRDLGEAEAAMRADRLWMMTVDDGGPSLDLDLVHRRVRS